jgi:hypothetical protein
MATKRKYAYYLKGNNIAIIEENIGSGVCSLSGYSNQTTCEAAGGTWTENAFSSEDNQYKSPVATIEDGLEIQYAYSPTFNLQSTGTEGSDFHRFLGWGSDGTNLLLFTFGASDYSNISSLFAANDWIYISGSGRWSGLHQVKSTGAATGILTLKTKCNLRPSKITVDGTFSTTAETFNGDSSVFDMDIEAFKDAQSHRSTAYVFVTVENDNAANKGLFSLTSDSTSGQLTFNNRITIDADGDYTSTAANITNQSDDASTFYNAFYEQISVYEGVEVLQDESFELDLSRYQANAVVYYLKAKMAEDVGDFDKREFFMREFKRQLEKGVGALKRGPYIVQGFKEMT